MTRVETALLAAAAHVYRQQKQGVHDQDKIDAKEWFEVYGDLVRELQAKRRASWSEEGRDEVKQVLKN